MTTMIANDKMDDSISNDDDCLTDKVKQSSLTHLDFQRTRSQLKCHGLALTLQLYSARHASR